MDTMPTMPCQPRTQSTCNDQIGNVSLTMEHSLPSEGSIVENRTSSGIAEDLSGGDRQLDRDNTQFRRLAFGEGIPESAEGPPTPGR